VSTPLLLIGAGGHCRSCIEAVESSGQFEIVGIVGRAEELNSQLLGYTVRGTDEDLEKLVEQYPQVLIAIGQIKSAAPRVRMFSQLEALDAEFPCIIASSAIVSRYASVQRGTILMHGAIANSNVQVGQNSIINSRALLEHDVTVGDHCHVSTAAVLNGGVSVGEETFIGSGAVVYQDVRIGKRSIIPAGAIVHRDVADDEVFRSG